MTAETFNFPNFGYLMDDVPSDILSLLKNEVKLINDASIKMNIRLAGNLQEEFNISHIAPKIEPYILNLLYRYNKDFNYLETLVNLTDNVPFTMNDLWLNLQHKTEFNPNHDHSGIMSFVIWLKIPYTREQENLYSPGRESNKNCSGNFELLYTSTLGNISYLHVPTQEGKILMFPNKMIHCVYPFYSSDEKRISISGNIYLKTDQLLRKQND